MGRWKPIRVLGTRFGMDKSSKLVQNVIYSVGGLVRYQEYSKFAIGTIPLDYELTSKSRQTPVHHNTTRSHPQLSILLRLTKTWLSPTEYLFPP